MSGNFYCEGVDKAPQRSLFHALGMTKEEMERPLVGIVSSYNEIVPGHMNIDKIVDAVKMGVAMAGGTPVVFPAIAVCDGIAMGHKGMKYSLVTRDLIADSTECMALAHHFDALVMIPNCDKNVPGLLMAAARVNVPTVFVSGGPMLAGHVKGKKTSLSSMFEAVGSYAAGKFTMEDVEEFENNACPTAETIKALRIGKYRKRRCFFRMERTIADVGSATPFQIHISACDFFQRTRIPQLFQKHIRNHLLSPAFHRSPHTRRSCGCFPTNHSSSGGNRSATSAKSASNCSPT